MHNLLVLHFSSELLFSCGGRSLRRCIMTCLRYIMMRSHANSYNAQQNKLRPENVITIISVLISKTKWHIFFWHGFAQTNIMYLFIIYVIKMLAYNYCKCKICNHVTLFYTSNLIVVLFDLFLLLKVKERAGYTIKYRVDSVIESSLSSKIMHWIIWAKTFEMTMIGNKPIPENLVIVR